MTDLQYTTMCNRIKAQGLTVEDLTDIINDRLDPSVPKVCVQEEVNYLLQQLPLPEEVETILIDVFGLADLKQRWMGIPPAQMNMYHFGISGEVEQ